MTSAAWSTLSGSSVVISSHRSPAYPARARASRRVVPSAVAMIVASRCAGTGCGSDFGTRTVPTSAIGETASRRFDAQSKKAATSLR